MTYQNANQGDRTRRSTQIERSFASSEVFAVDEADKDGDAIGDVETNGGDGGSGCESDTAAQGRKGEAEGEESCEPDSSDGGTEAGIYFVEE